MPSHAIPAVPARTVSRTAHCRGCMAHGTTTEPPRWRRCRPEIPQAVGSPRTCNDRREQHHARYRIYAGRDAQTMVQRRRLSSTPMPAHCGSATSAVTAGTTGTQSPIDSPTKVAMGTAWVRGGLLLNLVGFALNTVFCVFCVYSSCIPLYSLKYCILRVFYRILNVF